MNFDFSEEQKLLKESIERWAQDNYSFDQRRASTSNEDGFSRDHYATFAQLGWLSVPFAEENGGYGGSIVDLAAIMEEFGRALVAEPVAANIVLFGGLVERAANDAQKSELLPKLIDGSLMGGVAIYEAQARFDMSNIACSAKADGDSYSLTGKKSLVIGGACAEKFLVAARTSGEQTEEHGISLFLVDGQASGLDIHKYELMDGHKVADLDMSNTAAELVGELDNAYPVISASMERAHVALCAEAVGIMETLNKTTVEYTKTRKQFGVPIASFQVLQHRMVDSFMSYEMAKSLLVGTLCELTDDDTDSARRSKLVNALRTLVAKNGKHVGDEAIQMHGGMGMTDELHVGHYVKRLMMINLMFGDQSFYQDQFNQVSYS